MSDLLREAAASVIGAYRIAVAIHNECSDDVYVTALGTVIADLERALQAKPDTADQASDDG